MDVTAVSRILRFSALSLSLSAAAFLLLLPPQPGHTQGTPGIYLAKIYRDEIGIAHVWGDRDEDVAYGVGRLVARDKPLRTIVALTIPAGKMAESVGAHWEGSDMHWIYVDRKAHAYQVPQRATSLWASYFRSGAGPDEIEIRNLMVAYVEGIKDEIMYQTPEGLADAYMNLKTHPHWPYGEEFKLSRDQYVRLFSRVYGVGSYRIDYWEPFAAHLYWLGRIQDALGDDLGVLDQPDSLKSFFGFGSSSWGVTGEATTDGFAYLQADSHNPPYLGHVVRFKSRLPGELLDGGGVSWEGFGPFLINGAFSAHCGWATMLFGCDVQDTYEFEGQYSGGKFRYNQGSKTAPDWKDLAQQNLGIRYYDFVQQTLCTMTKTVFYLDPSFSKTTLPNQAILWAAYPENDGWGPGTFPTKIRMTRLNSLEPGIPGSDPPVDHAKALYKMMTATDAEDLVDNAFGQYPWSWPLNFMVGSGNPGSATTLQLICLPTGRVPFRYNEYPAVGGIYFWYYYDVMYKEIVYKNTPNADWILDSGVMFHPLNHFPVLKAHAQVPVVKYIANCNTSPQWVFGRNTPFPGINYPTEENLATAYRVDPRYRIKFNGLDYQVNPWFSDWGPYTQWLIQTHQNGGVSPSITRSYGEQPLPNAFGVNDWRQEWAINRLQRLYEGTGSTVRKISEQDMRDLRLSRIDSAAWYFKEMKHGPQQKNWFETAKEYLSGQTIPNKPQALALLDELKNWAVNEDANLNVESGSYRQTPLKWYIFWYYFRGRPDTPLIRLHPHMYSVPYHFYWPHATTTLEEYKEKTTGKYLHQEALKEAVISTVARMGGISQEHLLKDTLQITIPFTDVKIPTVGSGRAHKLLAALDWESGWETSLTPKRNVAFAGRLPLLIRFRKGSGPSNDRKVWVMNNGIPTDFLNVQPEWQGTAGRSRYEEGYRKMANGEFYEWPLTETDPKLTWMDDVTNLPPVEILMKNRKKK